MQHLLPPALPTLPLRLTNGDPDDERAERPWVPQGAYPLEEAAEYFLHDIFAIEASAHGASQHAAYDRLEARPSFRRGAGMILEQPESKRAIFEPACIRLAPLDGSRYGVDVWLRPWVVCDRLVRAIAMVMGSRAEIFPRGLTSSLIVVLMLLGGVRPAKGADTRTILLLRSRASAELETQVRPALKGQLRELDVSVVEGESRSPALAEEAPRLARAASALAVVWLEESGSAVVVYLYDAVGHHLYTREVRAMGSPTSMAEEIAIVLRSAVFAVLEGHVIAMIEVPLRAKPPDEPSRRPKHSAPTPARRNEQPARVRVSASYVGTVFSRSVPFQHGARGGLSLRLPRSPFYVGAGYTYFPPLSLTTAGVQVELARHPGEVVAGAELGLGAFDVTAEGALLADRLRRSAQSEDAATQATPPSARWLWAVSTRLGGALRLADHLRVHTNIGAEFLLNRFDQVIDSAGGGPIPVSSPLSARPRFELGFTLAW